MAKGIEAMLQKLQFKDLLKICDAEKLPKTGKKTEIIKRILENVPEEKLMKHFLAIRGITNKILEHEYVPKHRIMKKEEVEELLKKYGIKKWQLPKILDSDPVVMLLGAKPGDVLEITRKSPTAGEAKYYRVVIKGVKEE